MSSSVTVTVDPQRTGRNRLTTFFRLILAIPHMILVGAGDDGPGLLGLVAYVMAIFSGSRSFSRASTSRGCGTSVPTTFVGACGR